MLHPFISTETARLGRTGTSGLTLSVVLHASLVATAVVATTTRSYRVTEEAHGSVERVTFVDPARLEAARAARAAASEAADAARRAAARLAALRRAAAASALASVQLPEVPAIDIADFVTAESSIAALEAAATEGLDFAPVSREALLRASTGRAPALLGGRDVYTEDMVETAVAARPGNPIPRYPYALQAAQVQQSFVVHFVVDSTGRVEGNSLDFPRAVHRQFALAVRQALLRSRFHPAVTGGRRVRQVVRQQFSFVIVNR